jgi:hypothetical protein
MSTFKELSRLINVSDLCEPFIGEFDSSEDVAGVYDQWMCTCSTKDIDPTEPLALVKKNGKTIGTIIHEDLDEYKSSDGFKKIEECNINHINVDSIISSDTPSLEAVRIICSGASSEYLVLSENQFIGYLEYEHFNKLSFRMCLFALLIEIEQLMMKIPKSNPAIFLKHLSENRLNYAKTQYKRSEYSFDNEGREYGSNLIDCTTFCDKFTMLRKDSSIKQKCPNIKDKSNIGIAEKLRNSLAHPDSKESGQLSIKSEQMIPFIQWIEGLQKQLYEASSPEFIIL